MDGSSHARFFFVTFALQGKSKNSLERLSGSWDVSTNRRGSLKGRKQAKIDPCGQLRGCSHGRLRGPSRALSWAQWSKTP